MAKKKTVSQNDIEKYKQELVGMIINPVIRKEELITYTKPIVYKNPFTNRKEGS